jgi:GntR family transcriptional regulator of vanillate catabolism
MANGTLDAPTGDRLVSDLRQAILSGAFAQESRVVEETIARERGLSRTPVRHALRALELEGLLSREPRRGYRVRSFTIDEVADAIEVRAEVEAMAARLHAERGWIGATRARVFDLADKGRALTRSGMLSDADRLAWADLNLAFHDTLVHGTGNVGLIAAYEQLKKIPLVSPRAVVFEPVDSALSLRQITAAEADHDQMIEAIDQRRGQRAAEVMRAHGIRSGDTKRKNAAALLADELLVGDLGAALVRI